MTPRRVTVVEVGPRDGLQNEQATVSTADKIEFVNRLTAAHLPVIETGAFVSPKWVPQMADAAEVFAGIARAPGTRYTALVPNLAGLDRAIAAGVSEIARAQRRRHRLLQRHDEQSFQGQRHGLPLPVTLRCARSAPRRATARDFGAASFEARLTGGHLRMTVLKLCQLHRT